MNEKVNHQYAGDQMNDLTSFKAVSVYILVYTLPNSCVGQYLSLCESGGGLAYSVCTRKNLARGDREVCLLA